jgi:GAF domain-containing protein
MAAAVAHAMSKRDKYAALNRTLAALLAVERDWIANLANTAALIHGELEDINWVGFYLFQDGELVLGPFQGKPACVRIAIGKGVCGTAAQRRSEHRGAQRARVRRTYRVR